MHSQKGQPLTATSTLGIESVLSPFCFLDYERVPLPGREAEYEAVLDFVHARVQLQHRRVLFVFGACGCGKTSTVLRALRSFHAKGLPCDSKIKLAAFAQSQALRHIEIPCDDKDAEAGVFIKKQKVDNQLNDKLQTMVNGSINCARLLSLQRNGEKTGDQAVTTVRESDNIAGVSHCSEFLSPQKNTTVFCPFGHQEDKAHKDKKLSLLEYPTPGYFQAQYADLYAHLINIRGKQAQGCAQAHYINCSDLSLQQLVEAITQSIHTTYPRRTDSLLQELLDMLKKLTCTSQTGRKSSQSLCENALGPHTAEGAGIESCVLRKRSRSARFPLQVVVLDEIEYARPAARAVLSALVSWSFAHPAILAPIFISNVRELVHVPQILLEELAFEAYSVEALKSIGQAIAQAESLKYAHNIAPGISRDGVSGSGGRTKGDQGGRHVQGPMKLYTINNFSSPISISPSLYEYIARKALFDYAGDVRHVTAMCCRVVYTAYKDILAAEKEFHTLPSHTLHPFAIVSQPESGLGCDNVSMHKKLHAIVESYSPPAIRGARFPYSSHSLTEMPREENGGIQKLPSPFSVCSAVSTTECGRDSTHSSGSSQSAAAEPKASGLLKRSPQAATATVTLAKSMKILKACAIDEHLSEHIATMPEQVLYVLSCLIILYQKNEQWKKMQENVGGGVCSAVGRRASGNTATHTLAHMSSLGRCFHSVGAQSTAFHNSLTRRQASNLYTALMNHHHFPSMNGLGVSTAIDWLADLGIITRPQKRGTEEVFTFNGTWNLKAVQTALFDRGERLRKEMDACGLDGSENKFAAVLRDLEKITEPTFKIDVSTFS